MSIWHALVEAEMSDGTGDKLKSTSFQVRVPGFLVDDDIGLGTVLKRITTRLGVKPCGGCLKRAATLDRRITFRPPTVK